MTDLLRGAGQFVVIAALFAGVVTFSNWPAYRQLPEGQAVVTLSLVHGADRQAECRRLSPAEIAKLPPNMRRVQDCPRGRRPIVVELDLDGRTVFSEVLATAIPRSISASSFRPASTMSRSACATRRARRASTTNARTVSRLPPSRCSS
jgi:hypothetical protein